MKILTAILLIAIFGVVLFGVVEQHENTKRQEHEQAEQTLDECWHNAAANGGAGADLCKMLADSINK